jgi:hypothetical protein
VPTSVTMPGSPFTRELVLGHANAMECSVWRKVVDRIVADPEAGQPSGPAGMPTLGGTGALYMEDEEDYDYVERGDARCLFLGPFIPTT